MTLAHGDKKGCDIVPTSNKRKMVDDIWYSPGEEYPDLGSIVCQEYTKMQRTYQGLSEDADKLPTIGVYPQYEGHIGAGSSCLMLDTGELYMYNVSNDTWYLM